MNKRFCNLGRHAIKAFILFAMCGATYSCKDDYRLDDENPTGLGSSIYGYLQSQGNYTNFVKLIDDLEYKEVLARTGSMTLFVANDDAFDTFYQNNAWGVHSYGDLSKSQKKLLLYSAMMRNAYLLEMMSSTPAKSGDDNALPNKGQALRRETASTVTDSVPHLFSEDLPISYNVTDKDYWTRFRNNEKGIYLALDATAPMMTHFLPAQMANQGITDDDFAILTGQTRDKNDAYIYDCKVVEQDITCQNGYLNRLDKVLVNPQNMAEVLRTGEQTKIFSHMIDRFSAPFYNANLTASYRLLYGNEVDSVFEKRYFSRRSQNYKALNKDEGTTPTANSTITYALEYDPGWNTLKSDSISDKEQDMGAIFCPTDEKLIQYFFDPNGGGRFLIKAYAPDYVSRIDTNTKDLDLIYHAIDQIPLNVIQKLLNNLMKPSFNNTVPSKFETIKNSAQDPMFDEKNDYHRKNIVDVIFANNGVIYLMDEVITPAEYAAVLAPTETETDKKIFDYALEGADGNGMIIDGAPLFYDKYLLAMSSRFSFFVPRDNFWYIDPLSFHNPEVQNGSTVMEGRAYRYVWDYTRKTEGELKVTSYKYNYDFATKTGTVGEEMANEVIPTACYNNRLKDMLETHTIIHEDNTETIGINETETGAECNKHYFYTKNNAVLYADNATSRTHGMTVKGGWQINSGDECNVIGFDDKSAETNGYGNGFAYMIDQPMVPTIESVYSAMYNNPNFSKFFELCQTDDELLGEFRTYDEKERAQKLTDPQKTMYKIFDVKGKDGANNGLPCYGYKEDGTFGRIAEITNVRFFNNYRYTIYVPTNAEIEAAEAKGLPTWQQIRDLYFDGEETIELPSKADSVARDTKAIAMATAIVNFVRYHFQDNSVFADAPAMNETEFETACINSETNVYRKVSVHSAGNGTLSVKDVTGAECSITNDKNIIARDYIVKSGGSRAIDKSIITSSSAVLHGINGVLNYKPLVNGRYDSDWSSLAKARAYLKKYRLTE